MIVPIPKRPGWFKVDPELARQVCFAPGVELVIGPGQQSANVHRTHLPLLDSPDADRFMYQQKSMASSGAWQVRDHVLNEWANGLKLRTTQQQAIDFLSRRTAGLLGDDMRLGKTYSALCTHLFSLATDADGHFRNDKLVIVAPLSTRAMWLGSIKRIFPEADVSVLLGKTFDPKALDADVIFAHYDVLVGWQAIESFGTIVFDEAHFLTNRNARRTLAANVLRVKARRAIAMTGTPVWNMPPDFWSILNLVEPGAWGNYYNFSDRYGAPITTAHGKKYTGLSNENELNARLSEIMLRRRWVDVADDLPPISRSVVVAEVPQATRNKLDILAAKLKSERTNTVGNLAAYRRQLTTIKQATVVREAQKVLSRGRPVVVWTWHRDFAESLQQVIPGSQMISGDVAPNDRDERIGLWRASSEPGVLIATMAVAQVGIDLTHPSFKAISEIFAEIDYTPAIIGQAEMRPYDPNGLLDVIYVVADHIVDQRIVRALIAKLGAASPVGVGAACEAIDALRDAVMGPQDTGDLDRLLEDLLASQE